MEKGKNIVRRSLLSRTPVEPESINSDILSNDGEDIPEQHAEQIDDPTVSSSSAHQAKSSGRIIWDLFWSALARGFSFTFSFELVAIVVLRNLISKEEDEKDIAATTLISTMMFAVMMLATAFLWLSMNPSVKPGVMKKKINDRNWEMAKDENDQNKEIISDCNNEINVISDVSKCGILAAALLSIFTFLPFYFSNYLLMWVGRQDAEVAEKAQESLGLYAFAAPAVLFRMSFEQVMFMFQKNLHAMLMGLFNFGLGTFFAVGWGFGYFGLPKLGYAGIVYGYMMETYLTAICYGLYIKCKKEFRDYEFFNVLNRSVNFPARRKEIYEFGKFVLFLCAADIAMSIFLGIFSGLISTTAQSAMTCGEQLIFFSSLWSYAFAQVSGQSIKDANDKAQSLNVRRIAIIGLLTSLIVVSILPSLVAFLPQLSTFTLLQVTPEIIAQVNNLMPVLSPGVLLDCARTVLINQLRYLGDVMIPAWISMASLGIGILSSGLLVGVFKLGINWDAAGYTIGMFLTTAGLMVRWCQQLGKNAHRGDPEIAERNKDQVKKDEPSFLTRCGSSLFSCCRRREPSGDANESLLAGDKDSSLKVAVPV